MRISLDWLREYAALDAPPETLAAALVESGTEVDRVHRVGDGVVVARITALQRIPEARTEVFFADLDAGGGVTERVITGAPNLSVGDLVPWARPGAELPGFDEPLQVRPMFGGRYSSPGMLCSAVELGAGEDAEGIMILSQGTPGQALRDLIPLDVVMDVDVTTNRPDCLCHVGIARELAAALGEALHEPATDVASALTSATSIRGRVRVRVEDTEACPRFVAAVIEGVVVGPSPEWMQQRLRAIGVRPLNNVVDVTNYVAHELGQPLHAFDHHRVVAEAGGAEGDPAELTVRRGRGETLLCLDDVERVVGPEDIAVCAGDRVVSIAGVIGGSSTAVTEKTTTVLLEAATWHGPAVRATSRRLGLRTDASALFEKGLSDTLPPPALGRAVALIAEHGRGHALRGVVDRHSPPAAPGPIIIDEGFLSSRLGYAVDASEAATALARLGFEVEQEPGRLHLVPPHFRRDVAILEDVVEEVGRSLGYARVPSTLPGRRRQSGGIAPEPPAEDRVRDLLVGAGFDEAITYSFTSAGAAGIIPGLGEGVRPLPISNPLSEEWSVMRTSLLPGLCQAAATNVNRGLQDLAVFEVGRAFWEGRREGAAAGGTRDGADRDLAPLPAEPLLLAMVMQSAGDEGSPAAANLRHARSVLDALVRELGGSPLEVAPGEVPGLRPGRSGRLRQGGLDVGVIGELAADRVHLLELRGRVVVAELRLDAVAPQHAPTPRYQPPPRFPAVLQDLAVVVPQTVTAGEALAQIRAAGAPLLDAVDLYDEYRDERLGADRKGWTFRLAFRAADRTLTGAEAAVQQEAIVEALRQRCGAAVRG